VAKLVLIIVAVSYLLGSIPFGYLLVRIFRGVDVRTTGSGNIGATNVARLGSKALGIATLLLDALKGYAAVWIAGILVSQSPHSPDIWIMGELVVVLMALAGLSAIVGHMFPVWLGFRGGKGVATAAGAFAALAPRALLLALVAFAIVVGISRYVSLGSIVAAISFPIFFYLTAPPERMNLFVALLMSLSSLLIVVRHKDNIRRLLAGTENRLR
jgi:acyl phosphate:glycerol-3-phosphate acyltransferase